MLSVVIPVYRNRESIPSLIAELEKVDRTIEEALGETLECVFVVDGCPDDSYGSLSERLPKARLTARLVGLSRNYGSFAAIRTGLRHANGTHFAVIAADLQEPPGLLLQFFEALLRRDVDVVIGSRAGRDDPWMSRVSSSLFWMLYRRFVVKEIPKGGVDVFGCSRRVRDLLVAMEEAHSSLVGQLFWVGFSREVIAYRRVKRAHGKSSWNFSKKVRYLLDSVYSFTDLPIRILIAAGALGLVLSFLIGSIVLVARLIGRVDVPGYAATLITVLFFGALNTLGLGIIGNYAWRTYENTKRRPLSIVAAMEDFSGRQSEPGVGEGGGEILRT